MKKKNRIEKEKEIVKLMIEIYCSKNHKTNYKKLCSECSKCPIHCYKKDMKMKIKEVMRFSGWRLIVYKPYEFVRHIFK